MDEKMLLEAIGRLIAEQSKQMSDMMDSKLETLHAEINERFDKVDQRMDAIEHKSDVLMTGVRLANSKLSQVVASQNYTLEQLDILDEVKLDKDPMRKRA